MVESDYIPLSLVEKIYSEVDTTQDHDPPCTLIKTKRDGIWKTSEDITLNNNGLIGKFIKII